MAQASLYEPITYGLGLSPESTVYYGYSGGRKTLAQLDNKLSWNRLHPELRRRLLAMFFSHPDTKTVGKDSAGCPILESPMGQGGGARDPIQQLAEFKRRHSTSPTGRSSRWYNGVKYYLKQGMAPYAPPGSSNHEDGTLEGFAAAIDTIGHGSWSLANAGKFGLKHFNNVNGEPWHYQLVEYANSKSGLVKDYDKGVRHVFYALPVFGTIKVNQETCDCDALKPVEPPTAEPIKFPEVDFAAGKYGLWPLNANKPKLSKKLRDEGELGPEDEEAVRYAQAVVGAGIDGDFGSGTESKVKTFQSKNGLTADGWVGKNTWTAIDKEASS